MINLYILEKIFRSYDTRFRLTDRRPDIYLSEKIFSGDEVTTTILKINDPNDESELAQFGVSNDNANNTETSKRDWIWTFRGKLLIIATPYRSGCHYATNLNQFIPIIKHLTTLHENGFVHGDIRAYNMILQDETNGWLIDFDYGGKVEDKVTYPFGYKDSLLDGARRGQPLMEITKDDDWYALFQLMTSLYVYELNTDANDEEEKIAWNFNKFIRSIRKKFEQNKTAIDDIKLIPGEAAKLKNNKLVPFVTFKSDLKKNGFIGANERSEEDKLCSKHALNPSDVAAPSQRPKLPKINNEH